MLREYDRKIKRLLDSKPADTNWKEILKTHQEMISIIRHERLLHLLVMLTVAIIVTIVFALIIVLEKMILLLLGVPLLSLFIGYIIHYRFLENTTQNWHKLSEEIKKNL